MLTVPGHVWAASDGAPGQQPADPRLQPVRCRLLLNEVASEVAASNHAGRNRVQDFAESCARPGGVLRRSVPQRPVEGVVNPPPRGVHETPHDRFMKPRLHRGAPGFRAAGGGLRWCCAIWR